MKSNPSGSRLSFPTLLERLTPWLAALVCLAPLVIYHRIFRELYWFGDDWDMLDQIDQIGFWRWTWLVFGENFVPVFKLFWGGLAVGVHNHFVQICAVWLNHALNVALLGLVMKKAGLSNRAALLAMLVFGLTPANIEMLGWTVQWSPVLSMMFFLLAMLWYMHRIREDQSWGFIKYTVLFFLIACSTLCFSRGVLTSILFALMSLWPVGLKWFDQAGRRVRSAIICAIPGLAVVAVMMMMSDGNHRHFGPAHFKDAAIFGFWYFSLNPLYRILEMDSWGWLTTSFLAAGKIFVICYVLSKSKGAARWFFVSMLLFDLGNAAVVGIGRFHTGLGACISSRYQFSTQVSFFPFLAFVIDPLFDLWRRILPGKLTKFAIAACFFCLVLFVCKNWTPETDAWVCLRGRETRTLLFANPNPPMENAIPGIASMPTARAKELVKKYELK